MLTNEHFEQISNEIVQLFLHENKEIYFIPPICKKDSKENKAGISRGKLVDKFRNDIKFIKSVNNSKNQAEQNVTNTGIST